MSVPVIAEYERATGAINGAREHAGWDGDAVGLRTPSAVRSGAGYLWGRGIAGIEFDVAVRDEVAGGDARARNVVSGMFFMTGSLGLAYP
jgi:hypothetical protein